MLMKLLPTPLLRLICVKSTVDFVDTMDRFDISEIAVTNHEVYFGVDGTRQFWTINHPGAIFIWDSNGAPFIKVYKDDEKYYGPEKFNMGVLAMFALSPSAEMILRLCKRTRKRLKYGNQLTLLDLFRASSG